MERFSIGAMQLPVSRRQACTWLKKPSTWSTLNMNHYLMWPKCWRPWKIMHQSFMKIWRQLRWVRRQTELVILLTTSNIRWENRMTASRKQILSSNASLQRKRSTKVTLNLTTPLRSGTKKDSSLSGLVHREPLQSEIKWLRSWTWQFLK